MRGLLWKALKWLDRREWQSPEAGLAFTKAPKVVEAQLAEHQADEEEPLEGGQALDEEQADTREKASPCPGVADAPGVSLDPLGQRHGRDLLAFLSACLEEIPATTGTFQHGLPGQPPPGLANPTVRPMDSAMTMSVPSDLH